MTEPTPHFEQLLGRVHPMRPEQIRAMTEGCPALASGVEMTDFKAALNLYHLDEVLEILRNVGVDTTCDACMATAFTGAAPPGLAHTCRAETWFDPKTWAEKHTYETFACRCGVVFAVGEFVKRATFDVLLRQHCGVAHGTYAEMRDLGDATAYRWGNGAVAIFACDGWYFGRLPAVAK